MVYNINENYLEPTGFKMVLDRKFYPKTEYFVTSVTHPEVSLPGVAVPFKSITTHQPGERLQFGELIVNVILDEDLVNYTEMYEILKESIQVNDINRLTRDVTQKPLDMDLKLYTLTSKNNANKEITYYDARLTSIGEIALESTRADIQYFSVPLNFEFSYFEIE
jgi:hypothetical protein|tara:strand:+ start:136 stop:630 length:495 start_codon:yes stop_codon:yes gene_type:complete